MLEAIMEVVSLCAGHRELVQSNLEELNTIYSTRLEILLSSETLGSSNSSSNSSSNNNNISNNHSSSYQIAANDILNSRETKHTEFLSQYLPSLSNDNHDDEDDYLNDGSDNNLNNFSTIQSPYRFPTASSTTKKRNKKNKQQQQQSRQSTTTAAPISKHIDREQQQHHHYQSTHHNHTDNENDDVVYGDTYSLSSDAFDEAPPHVVVATVVPSSPTYSPSLDYGDIYPHDSALKDEVR